MAGARGARGGRRAVSIFLTEPEAWRRGAPHGGGWWWSGGPRGEQGLCSRGFARFSAGHMLAPARITRSDAAFPRCLPRSACTGDPPDRAQDGFSRHRRLWATPQIVNES